MSRHRAASYDCLSAVRKGVVLAEVRAGGICIMFVFE